jgi:hypothetical protein
MASDAGRERAYKSDDDKGRIVMAESEDRTGYDVKVTDAQGKTSSCWISKGEARRFGTFLRERRGR